MALAREDKERIVQEVKEVSASASSLVISDARGLKVSELTEIRKQGTESGVHIQVIKNSLAKLAFEGTDFGCTDEVLTGPSLFAFSYAEPGAAAKMLKTYAKNFEALEIKALVVEGQLLDGSQIDVRLENDECIKDPWRPESNEKKVSGILTLGCNAGQQSLGHQKWTMF